MTTTHRRAPILDFYKEWKTQRRRDKKADHDRRREDRAEKQQFRQRRTLRKTSRNTEPSRLRTAYLAVTARVHPFTALVVTASMVAAWTGQYQAAIGLGMAALAFLVPLITEGATLAFARSAEEAVHEDRPAGMWRLLTVLSAVVAAALNYYGHTTLPLDQAEGLSGMALDTAQTAYAAQHRPTALIFAFASLAGLVVWEGSLIAKRRRKRGKTSRQALIARRRRFGNPLITWQARSLIRRNPVLSDDEAFVAAWTLRKGIGPTEKTPREIRRERRMTYLREQAQAWDGQRRFRRTATRANTDPAGRTPPVVVADVPATEEDSPLVRKLYDYLAEADRNGDGGAGSATTNTPPGGSDGGGNGAQKSGKESGQSAGQTSSGGIFGRKPKRATARQVRLTTAEKKLPYPNRVAAAVQRLTDAGVNVSVEAVRTVAGGRWETAKEALENLNR